MALWQESGQNDARRRGPCPPGRHRASGTEQHRLRRPAKPTRFVTWRHYTSVSVRRRTGHQTRCSAINAPDLGMDALLAKFGRGEALASASDFARSQEEQIPHVRTGDRDRDRDRPSEFGFQFGLFLVCLKSAGRISKFFLAARGLHQHKIDMFDVTCASHDLVKNPC